MMQENSSRSEHAAALRIAELEREATDSRDVHLSLAAQHEAKVGFKCVLLLAIPASYWLQVTHVGVVVHCVVHSRDPSLPHSTA